MDSKTITEGIMYIILGIPFVYMVLLSFYDRYETILL